jgi:hypothetical protein
LKENTLACFHHDGDLTAIGPSTIFIFDQEESTEIPSGHAALAQPTGKAVLATGTMDPSLASDIKAAKSYLELFRLLEREATSCPSESAHFKSFRSLANAIANVRPDLMMDPDSLAHDKKELLRGLSDE